MSQHAAVVGFLADWPNALPTGPLADPCAERVRQAARAATETPTEVGQGDLAGLIGHWLTARHWPAAATGCVSRVEVRGLLRSGGRPPG